MGALPIPSAPFGAENSDSGYGGLVRTGRILALGSARSASGEGGPLFSHKPGRRAPLKHPRRRTRFCAEEGRSSKAQKMDLPDGLPKCCARGATRLLCSVADCSNQARGARVEEADSLGPAGARCATHSPGMADMAKGDVRNIKFTGHRHGVHFASRPATIIDLDASRRHFAFPKSDFIAKMPAYV